MSMEECDLPETPQENVKREHIGLNIETGHNKGELRISISCTDMSLEQTEIILDKLAIVKAHNGKDNIRMYSGRITDGRDDNIMTLATKDGEAARLFVNLLIAMNMVANPQVLKQTMERAITQYNDLIPGRKA